MQVTHEWCCGIDVHKETVVACVIVPDPKGQPVVETRTFHTITGDLRALAEWLEQKQCTHVVMESTGVYWKPEFNLLEGQFEIFVVNAEHLKKIAGRKTDVQDAFGTGKSATMISFIQTGSSLGNFKDLKWNVMPIPYFVTPLTHTGGFTFAIPAKSKHPKQAMDFIKYMGSEEGIVTFYKAAGAFLPARTSIFTKYPDYFGKDWQQVFAKELIIWGVARPETPGYTAYDTVMSKGISDISLGANVEETINSAAKDIDNQLKQYKK